MEKDSTCYRKKTRTNHIFVMINNTCLTMSGGAAAGMNQAVRHLYTPLIALSASLIR